MHLCSFNAQSKWTIEMVTTRSSIGKILLVGLTAIVLTFTSSCGRNKKSSDDIAKHPPQADTPREHSGKGSPLLLFGGRDRDRPWEHDQEYIDYLIWREWQQYRKYKSWVKQQEQSSAPATNQQTDESQ